MIKGKWETHTIALVFYEEGFSYPLYKALLNKEFNLRVYYKSDDLGEKETLNLNHFFNDFNSPTPNEILMLELRTGLPIKEMFDKLNEVNKA